MKKAEEMRKITNKAIEQKRVERLVEHEKYASKIINRKVRLAAILGCSTCIIKVKKRFSSILIKEALEKHGFEVTECQKNGRSIFKLKW